MELSEYLDFENFRTTFGAQGAYLQNAARSIEKLNIDALRQLIYELFGMWAQTKDKQTLIAGVKRGIQTRYYKQLFGREPTEAILARDEEVKKSLILKPMEVQMTEATTPVTPEGAKPEKPKQKTEFALKVKACSLDDLIKWAIDVGVPQDKIDKHKSKALGLAKMNIANMIRARI